MRDAALLGAQCMLATPADTVAAADEGWSTHVDERAELLERIRRHETLDDPDRLRLCEGLGLDLEAYWLVMLCAAVELHPEAAAAVSLLTEDARLQLPTPTVVARLARGVRGVPYPLALAAALDGGVANRMGLVEVVEHGPGLPHSQHGLRLVLSELAGAHEGAAVPATQGEVLCSVLPAAAGTAFEPDVVRRAARMLQRRGLLVLRAASRRGGRQMACDIASVLERQADVVTVVDVLPGAAELSRVRRGLLVLDLHAATVPPAALVSLASTLGPLVAVVGESVDTGGMAVLDVGALRYPEAERVWAQFLGPADAQAMAARFRVNAEEARNAVREARDLQEHGSPGQDDVGPDVVAVADRVRALGARRMGRQVSVIEPAAEMSDLVVPEGLRRQLDEIVAWQRSRHRVRWVMELGTRSPTGHGLACLFSGKSGTGKTFAARCLAAELGLNLYRVDLSQVVSKYIGETEKALAGVFDEVEAGHGVLLFDEADALFGRRSEVKDAHDRYANIEVGYLLQRLEAYEGVVVLTTNLQGNMDAAFIRRIRFVLQFSAPDRDMRRQLWQRSLPGPEWLDPALEVEALADRFQLTGGAIHNIGLAAAHLAAATESGRITAEHVVRATQRELQKTGRPFDAVTLGPLTGAVNGSGGQTR
jgi:hypothetical protein